jgi:tetratricopeptide (TPR) repeat protein
MTDRIEALRTLLQRNPNEPRAHFGLAAEYEKRADWAQVVNHLEQYLALAEDQGNAWGRLGKALIALGDSDRAVRAYQRGAEQARQHGHPSMAAEFEDMLEQLDS